MKDWEGDILLIPALLTTIQKVQGSRFEVHGSRADCKNHEPLNR